MRAQNKNSTSRSVDVSAAWTLLDEGAKEAWNAKSEQGKIHFAHQKDRWLRYVQRAQTLGLAVPTKSVRPLIPPIKIKNLLNLMGMDCALDKESRFVIAKAAELFVQFYAAKAAEVSDRSGVEQGVTLTARHCADAMQLDHKLNFLRAVTAPMPKRTSNTKSKVSKKRKLEPSNSECGGSTSMDSSSMTTTQNSNEAGAASLSPRSPKRQRTELQQYNGNAGAIKTPFPVQMPQMPPQMDIASTLPVLPTLPLLPGLPGLPGMPGLPTMPLSPNGGALFVDNDLNSEMGLTSMAGFPFATHFVQPMPFYLPQPLNLHRGHDEGSSQQLVNVEQIFN